jgi:hypothetical protein
MQCKEKPKAGFCGLIVSMKKFLHDVIVKEIDRVLCTVSGPSNLGERLRRAF